MTGRDPLPRAGQNLPRGTQLNNMFELDEWVSADGMGALYKGHNIQTYDPVAIKIVLPEFARDERILELLRTQARILSHLHHDAIVRYYVFSIDTALGMPFLAMEFVEGPSLAERMKAGPLDLASVVTLQRHLADGLDKAHRAGMIHRDISPDNIILQGGRVDQAKIKGFGIARSASAGGGTRTEDLLAGDDNFVSPEQRGLFGGDVTSRSDIYSFGLVLAACVLGHPLDMSGSQVEMIEKRRSIPDLTGIDPPLLGLIEAMVQPDPQDRLQSMAEVAEWPTFEGPLPELESTPVAIAPPEQPSPLPISPPSQLSAEEAAADEAPREPSLGVAPQEPGAVDPRHARPRRRMGLIAAGIALAAVLLGGLGVWAYIEYGSEAWYQDLGRSAPVAADPAPPAPADDAVAAATDTPAPPEPDFSPADIRIYVNSYDGGACFFAYAASIGEDRAEIIGYANRAEAFESLRDAFRRRFGFDAAMEQRQVSEPQCVVVDAFSRLAGNGAPQPALALNKGALRSGETLLGTVSGLNGRHLAVMMLDSYGFMHNLAGFTTRDDDVVRLEMPLHRQNPADPEPQLIVTVASAEPLQSLDFGQLTPARQVIPALLEEIAAKPAGLGTAVGYFSFGG